MTLDSCIPYFCLYEVLRDDGGRRKCRGTRVASVRCSDDDKEKYALIFPRAVSFPPTTIQNGKCTAASVFTPDVINVVTLSRPFLLFLHAPFPSLSPSHIIMKEGKHFFVPQPLSFILVSWARGPLCVPSQAMSPTNLKKPHVGSVGVISCCVGSLKAPSLTRGEIGTRNDVHAPNNQFLLAL